MQNLLIVYSSHDGQTLKICQSLADILRQADCQATVLSIDDVEQVDIGKFSKIVVGASIRYGKHSPKILAFIKNNQAILDSKPNAFFSVNVVARKVNKNSPATNPYLQKFLRRITWKPKHLAVFAGKLDYPSYSFFDRMMIRLIMWITRGPTDPKAVVEFTDWQQVNDFAQRVLDM